ncbi:proteasome subunit alpha [Natrialbaceae archaeon A-CW3]
MHPTRQESRLIDSEPLLIESELEFDTAFARGTATDSHQHRTDTPMTVVSTGTTIVGATGTDSVVLAGDTRASLGGRFVTNQDVRKVEPIGDRAAVGFTGSVSSAQALVRQLRAEMRLYEHRHNRSPSTSTLASMAASLLRSGRLPMLELVLVGMDEQPAVYSIGRDGSILESPFAAAGSGMQVAYGALEEGYRNDLSSGETRSIVTSAVAAATERDTASGDGMTIVTIRGKDEPTVEESRHDTIGSALEACSQAVDTVNDRSGLEGNR